MLLDDGFKPARGTSEHTKGTCLCGLSLPAKAPDAAFHTDGRMKA